jgi:hypothetical protein
MDGCIKKDEATLDMSSTPARGARRRTYLRELCQRFVCKLPLWKANHRIADAETFVNSNAFIMGFPKMRVLNVERVGQTHTK